MDGEEFRAELDARVAFSNGGSLQVEGFRVDVPDASVTREAAGTLLVTALGLLMTERVEVSAFRVFAEPHQGTRAGPSAAPHRPERLRRFVELSHAISAGMTTYPGLPVPQIQPHLTRERSRCSYAEGVEFAIDEITMVGNTGTYLDSPFHRYADGLDLASLPLERFVELPAVVVRTVGSGVRAVGVGAVAAIDVDGMAVLLHTGGDRDFGTPAYAQDAAFLSAEAARWLVDHGAALVGIDAVNIDDTGDPARPAHSILLGAGVPVVEHLTRLDQVPPSGARFTAAPVRVTDFGTFPVRAYAAV